MNASRRRNNQNNFYRKSHKGLSSCRTLCAHLRLCGTWLTNSMESVSWTTQNSLVDSFRGHSFPLEKNKSNKFHRNHTKNLSSTSLALYQTHDFYPSPWNTRSHPDLFTSSHKIISERKQKQHTITPDMFYASIVLRPFHLITQSNLRTQTKQHTIIPNMFYASIVLR